MSTPAEDVFDALKPGDSLLEYRIERILGQGGFGITYLARDTHLDASFAIKEFLPPELAARGTDNSVTVRSESTREPFEWAKRKFLGEARVLARFAHPNLVRVHRFFEANDTVYFVMEYVSGQTVGEWLKSGATVDRQRIESILLPLADGLAEVHAAGVLHRDIKPGNIILRADDSPILIDFGAARQSFGSVSKSLLNVVTAGYAPIEQYSEGMRQGPWTDIYALAAVAYRMIAGEKPQDAVHRVGEDRLTPAVQLGLGRFPPQLLAAIDWGLALKPDQRPQSLDAWCAALRGDMPVPMAAPSQDIAQTGILAPPGHPPAAGADEPTEIRPMNGPAPALRTADGPVASAARRWRPLWIGAVVLMISAALWLMRPVQSPVEPEPAEPIKPSVFRGILKRSTMQDEIAKGEEQLAAGRRDDVLARVDQRLAVDKKDPVALLLRGHLAFADGQRADGISDYALALAAQPEFASNERLAANLVSALGWMTAPAEGVIRTYTSEALLEQLVKRSLDTEGPAGRGHAYRILKELGEVERVDPLAFAKAELLSRTECDARGRAIETIGRLGDASWIPLLKAQIPNWLTNICLRGPINQAVAELEKRPAPSTN